MKASLLLLPLVQVLGKCYRGKFLILLLNILQAGVFGFNVVRTVRS